MVAAPPPSRRRPVRARSGRRGSCQQQQQQATTPKNKDPEDSDDWQEARAERRLQIFRLGFQPGHAVLARIDQLQLALRDSSRLAPRCARRLAALGARSEEEVSVRLLFRLLSPDTSSSRYVPLKRVAGLVRQLSASARSELKRAQWRCMNRSCGRASISQRVELGSHVLRLSCLRFLAAEAGGFYPHSAAEELPPALVGGDLKQRVLHYSSALAEEASGREDREAVAQALNALLDDAARLRDLARHLDWHHALSQAVRSYPAATAPQLVPCLLAAARDGTLGSSEPLKRLVLEVLRHCSDAPAKGLADLGRAAASAAVQELRAGSDLRTKRGCSEAPLTLCKVMLKSTAGPLCEGGGGRRGKWRVAVLPYDLSRVGSRHGRVDQRRQRWPAPALPRRRVEPASVPREDAPGWRRQRELY